MAKFLVAGGYDEQSEALGTGKIIDFVKALAQEIIEQGHVLIGGAQTNLDSDAAKAALAVCNSNIKAKNKSETFDPYRRIRSFIDPSVKPSHDIGHIGRSDHQNWSLISRTFYFPEPIDQADAIIFIGGFDGTYRAANWGRLARKPLVPVSGFGLAAAGIYRDEMNEFAKKYHTLVTREDFELLDRVIDTYDEERMRKYAYDVVSLAERLVSPSDVFIIMSYSNIPEFKDISAAFESVCREFKFNASRVDQKNDLGRIVDKIYKSIHQSAFVIADVTESRPNVYYELGYAKGLGKPVVVTAKEGTKLPFDIYDIPVHFWSGIEDLKDKLKNSIEEVAKQVGRA